MTENVFCENCKFCRYTQYGYVVCNYAPTFVHEKTWFRQSIQIAYSKCSEKNSQYNCEDFQPATWKDMVAWLWNVKTTLTESQARRRGLLDDLSTSA